MDKTSSQSALIVFSIHHFSVPCCFFLLCNHLSISCCFFLVCRYRNRDHDHKNHCHFGSRISPTIRSRSLRFPYHTRLLRGLFCGRRLRRHSSNYVLWGRVEYTKRALENRHRFNTIRPTAFCLHNSASVRFFKRLL